MQRWDNWFHTRINGRFHRQLIFLSGGPDWALVKVNTIIKAAGNARRVKTLWLGDSDVFQVRGLPKKQYKKLLGQECDIGIYDAHSEFKPSALLALSGTVKESGLLIICCPLWHHWAYATSVTHTALISHGFTATHSSFIQRWQQLIENDPTIWVEHQNNSSNSLPPNTPVLEHTEKLPEGFASVDQYRVYRNICATQNNDNIVVTAKRGRGKSALLGLVASYLTENNRKVTLCTALKANAQNVLKHCKYASKINWYAPDDKALHNNQDIVIIDEAANLPIQETLRILLHCKQFILASTTDGYEGTGRGFINKLLPKLVDKYGPNRVHQFSLNRPLRYAPNDNIENHLDAAFYLSPYHSSFVISQFHGAKLTTKVVKHSQQIDNESLNEWMQLLSLAHYQTTPEDSMRMLDSPDTFFVALYCKGNLIGIAVIIQEGCCKLNDLAADIASGARRARGHLFAQKLSLALANPSVLSETIWRINRIAVIPKAQNMGVGTQFIRKLEQIALNHKVSIIGAAFGMNKKIRRFWLKNAYRQVLLGSTPDKATGETSLFVAKSLVSKTAKAIAVLEHLNNLENPQKKYLSYAHTEYIDTQDQTFDLAVKNVFYRRILDYVNGARTHHHMGRAIYFWMLENKELQDRFSNAKQDNHILLSLLNKRWLESWTDEQLQRVYKINGRKKLYQKLWQAFAEYYWYVSEMRQ